MSFFELERRARSAHFNMLRQQPADKLRDTGRISLILWNNESIRRRFDALAPGVIALLVEVTQQRVRIRRGVVKRGERPVSL